MPIAWNDDPPESGGRIVANCRALLTHLAAEAARRDPPPWRPRNSGTARSMTAFRSRSPTTRARFATTIAVPRADRLRGDRRPEHRRAGAEVPDALVAFERRAQRACSVLDESSRWVGCRPTTASYTRYSPCVPRCTASGCGSIRSPTATGGPPAYGQTGRPCVTACHRSCDYGRARRDSHTRPRHTPRCVAIMRRRSGFSASSSPTCWTSWADTNPAASARGEAHVARR